MAGVVVAENPQRILRLYLHPTQQFRGRLVNSTGRPIIGRPVYATLRIGLEPKNRKRDAFYGFEVNRQTVKTDSDLPCGSFGLSLTTLKDPRGFHQLLVAFVMWLGEVELNSCCNILDCQYRVSTLF
jgi:hypothetical protein